LPIPDRPPDDARVVGSAKEIELPARALELAERGHARSIEALRDVVRIRSLTGEEGEAQQHIAAMLRGINAEITVAEPDVAAMFRRFPHIAQYPTHWQHDLILPYEELPTYEALTASGLQAVLNYEGRPNVTGIVRGTGGGRSLILNGHIDTVTVEPINQWTRDPFGAEIVDGVMYGRGTSDMKGGVMAALMAISYLHQAGLRARGDMIFQCAVNEEHAGNGTLDMVRRGQRADGAIVLEPTSNSVATSHPGGLYWQVTITGIPRSPGARWSAGRQEGVSAIEKVPVVVEALLALEREHNSRGATNGPAPFAMVIGKIAGGHYETVTAGEVVIKGGAYFAPAAGDVAHIMRSFRRAIAEANARDPYLREHPARLEFLHHDDSTQQPQDTAIARSMGAVLSRRGRDGRAREGAFCCDMRHLVNQGGIPSIIFGPGTIAQAHKPDEHILLKDYLDSIEHLIEFIWHWCNEDREE
jgi:acetylornithine deacetylase